MSKKSDHERFYWKYWQSGKLPELDEHSEKKLDLLRDYLVLYLQIVLKTTAATGKLVQEITLVDGFAGGGIYQGKKLGSPVTILKAVEEAEALVNQGRDKRMKIVPICYFIEKDPDAFACLESTLKAHNYGDAIGKSIHLKRDDFEKCAPEIVASINNRHKKGGNRTIFFLDQCGWTEISAATIRTLSEQLHNRPEFIVNFAISWLVDFISERTQAATSNSLNTLGLDGHVDIASMLKLRMELGGKWSHAIESHIGEGFHKATGIPFFSPFYIEPKDNHRGYWILHLAGNARARSAMLDIHWSKANRSKHYGHLGYDILSYKPNLDQSSFLEGMSFDEESKVKCSDILANDLSKLLYDSHEGGVKFGDFVNKISNKVIASNSMIEAIVGQLCQGNGFEALCPSGRKKSLAKFDAEDRIIPRRQLIITLGGVPDAVTAKRRKKSKAPNAKAPHKELDGQCSPNSTPWY